MRRQYELGTGLGEYEDEVLEPIKIKTQDMTFNQPTRKSSRLCLHMRERKGMPVPPDKP